MEGVEFVSGAKLVNVELIFRSWTRPCKTSATDWPSGVEPSGSSTNATNVSLTSLRATLLLKLRRNCGSTWVPVGLRRQETQQTWRYYDHILATVRFSPVLARKLELFTLPYAMSRIPRGSNKGTTLGTMLAASSAICCPVAVCSGTSLGPVI
jgi:hypothetical protein